MKHFMMPVRAGMLPEPQVVAELDPSAAASPCGCATGHGSATRST
jgi:hypothetical protein